MADPLSELLAAIRLDAAIYFTGEFAEPWLMNSAAACTLAPTRNADDIHVMTFHLLCEGTAYGESDSERVALQAGDLISFPHGDAHIMGAGVASVPIDSDSIFAHTIKNQLELFKVGGSGPRSRFICGFLVCDRRLAQSFVAGLPRILRVNLRNDTSGQWLENSLTFAVAEAGRRKAGSTAMLTKLSEVAFVETLRRYIQDLPPDQTGWLAGARDPDIGNALALLHRQPAYPWTLAELAQQVGVSRTVLAARFRHFLGESPIAYLTRWRLLLGARALTSSSQGVAQIASSVGYESEAAFNRAFKRTYGVPPARYRKDRANGASYG